ncbi:uncharacterized protein LOC131026762 isoform X2 [Cryptomeria japonica]|uniref:uncharacterized protein LOC131026762 isoform X2 n=1 Tax=Cryptomeria japonica TaxID=3369 RepID=UPI0027DAB193|nr:uncharacterized protein LOC131026762 isoform X2 [Cryptomeria japonica]
MAGGLEAEDKCRREVSSSMVIASEVVSVKKRVEGHGKSQVWFYVVECCRGSQVTRSKKYRCGERGYDDPDARLEALRCGFFAEGLLAFRNLLFPEGLGKGCSCYVCVRSSQASGMRFAAAVIRAGNGVIRGVSFVGEEDAAIQKALGFVRGPEFWIWVRKILALQAQGSSPGACRHCGQQQEEQEQDTRFGKQITEECICSACKKMEGGEITIIRVDDQGEYRAISTEESWKDIKSTEVTGGEPVCTFCGCEDSEKFEKMISLCHCNGGSVVAHPSCLRVSQADPRAGGNQALTLCKVCGGSGASSIGVDGMVNAASTEEGSSKLVDLNSSLSRDSHNLTPKKGVKHNPSDLTNGGSGAAEQLENQPPLKRFKGESGRKTFEVSLKDDLSTAESEKLGVTVPARRFDDAIVSVPIKKRKFWPPSPPPSSPKASSPLEPLHSEPPVSAVHSGRLSGTEEEQGPLNTHREQQVADGMDIAGESIQEKSVMLVGDMLNETRGKASSSVDCFSEDTVGNVDISGVSTSTMDASTSKLVRNSLDERVSQVGYPGFENAKSVAVNLKDTGICNPEDPQHDNMHEDTQNQGGLHERQDHHVLESNLLSVSPNKSYISNEIPACNSSNESVDNVACREETELALGRKSTLESSNRSEVVLGIKVTSEAGECSQHKSLSPLKDGQKQEKGMLLKLNSGYFDDDRSHWDLNTPMDSWEKQPEAVTSDPETKCSGKLPIGNAIDINSERLDSIPVQLFVSDAKFNSRKPEQDMLSKGLQSEQNDHVVHSLEGLALDKDSVLDMTLGLQADALLNHHPVNPQSKFNRPLISKSLSISLDKSNPERNLDLSIANSEMPCELADGISSTEVQDGKHSVESPPDVILGKEPRLQSDEQTDAMMIDVNADSLDKHSSPVMHDFESIEDSHEASALTDAKGNLRCLPISQEFPDCQEKSSPSLPAGKQDLNEIIDEDMNVDDTHTSVTCEVDAGAENIDIPGEDVGGLDKQSAEDVGVLDKQSAEDVGGLDKQSAEDAGGLDKQSAEDAGGLDKQSAEDAKEIAYGGDYETDGYDDEDDIASDAEKFVELAEDENQGEEGEYRETEELHDWIEEDVGEELEDEHVDYGDSDFRDADDLGMEQYDKGKDMEHERICDDIEKFEMDDQEAHDLQVGADGQVTIPETTTSGTGIEHSTEKETHKADGWDKLPEGYENVDEAFKAVQDIISKRGRGSPWPTGGRLGPMSARIPSSRIDAGFRERMTSDDSIHGKEAFYMRGRDGSLSTSPSFASRKPTRGRIVGRGGPSRGIHHRGRGDPWGDGASSHWGSSRHHSPPDYYGTKVGFGSPRSANAAAVSAAKVESSGFLVASDGTVTKITRGGGRGRRGRSTLMGRGSGMDIEESLDFGMQMSMGSGAMMSETGLNASRDRTVTMRTDAGGRVSRERYREPSFGHSRWDHSIGDSPRRSMDHRLRERNGSFSPPPGRRLTRMSRSHTESRSRSRTRSPRLRSSPRGRAGGIIDRGPTIRRRSRSPVLRSEARIERLKSPIYHRVGSFEHKMSFRTQRTSPQSSKWSYDRRDTSHFRDSDYRRPFVRSGSPRRISPRVVHESSLTESPGRLKHSDYRGSMYSSRTADLNCESRRFKHDENEDIRVKQSDISGRGAGEGGGMDVRRFRHQENESDCQPRSSCTKDSGISREQGTEDHNNRL